MLDHHCELADDESSSPAGEVAVTLLEALQNLCGPLTVHPEKPETVSELAERIKKLSSEHHLLLDVVTIGNSVRVSPHATLTDEQGLPRNGLLPQRLGPLAEEIFRKISADAIAKNRTSMENVEDVLLAVAPIIRNTLWFLEQQASRVQRGCTPDAEYLKRDLEIIHEEVRRETERWGGY